MASGVLGPASVLYVPGTVLLNEVASQAESQSADSSHPKHDKGRNAHIILALHHSGFSNNPVELVLV